MPLTRQQIALARTRKESAKAKSHKPKTSSNLRSMSTSEEPASANPDVNPRDDFAIPEHLESWLPGVASIDDIIPLPADLVIAKTTPGPKLMSDGVIRPDEKPKSPEQGKNRSLKASTVRQLNVRLRKYGLIMKRIVPAHVNPIPGVQTNSESIQSSDELAEYEIVGMKGESKAWTFSTLAAAAEQDKANKIFQMQVEKERAERKAAGDDENEAASYVDGEDKETAVGSDDDELGENSKARKRTGSGPPLGVFYEPMVPAAPSRDGK